MTNAVAVDVSDDENLDIRVNGVVDLPTNARIAGWAIDRADPNAHVTVDVFREGALIASVPATSYRQDLERNGIGTGKYGFKIDLDQPIEPELAFTVTARARTHDGVSGPLRNTGRTVLDDDRPLRVLQRIYTQLGGFRQDMDRLSQQVAGMAQAGPDDSAADVLARIELVQARLESGLAEVEQPPAPPRATGLRWAVGAALLLGAGSLVLGLWSLWVG